MRINEGPPSQLINEFSHDGITFREFPNRELTAIYAADYIAAIMRKNPSARVTYATGATMEPVYENLIITGVNATQTSALHLDEYVGSGPSDPESFVRFLRDRTFNPLGIVYRHEMDGQAEYPEREAERYEEVVSVQPADLVILGIGPGGHIAFNERGTDFGLGVHVQRLSDETVQRDVERGQTRRDYALTQGPRNIIQGRELLVVLYGQQKGQWLGQSMYGAIDPEYPASILRLADVAPKVTVYLDSEAANSLNNTLGGW